MVGDGPLIGAPVNVKLRPAPADHGVVFVRTDLPKPVEIPATAKHVVSTELATSVGCVGAQVGTATCMSEVSNERRAARLV